MLRTMAVAWKSSALSARTAPFVSAQMTVASTLFPVALITVSGLSRYARVNYLALRLILRLYSFGEQVHLRDLKCPAAKDAGC